MSNALSLVEVEEQRVELLPARTLLSMVNGDGCGGGCSGCGTGPQGPAVGQRLTTLLGLLALLI